MDKKIKRINKVLSKLPEYMYHGRIGLKIDKEELYKNIEIYNSKKEIENISIFDIKGRTNLDFAFHGFYLTPCEALAKQWAFSKKTKAGEVYQVLKFKLDIPKLNSLNKKNVIVPDIKWAKHILKNRNKLTTQNEFDFVYGFLADGKMRDIEPLINKGFYEDDIIKFHYDVIYEYYNGFLNNYYKSKTYSSRKIIDSLKLNEYKNYQFCISSKRALKYIKLVDIEETEINPYKDSKINIYNQLKDYKKFVDVEIINSLKAGD